MPTSKRRPKNIGHEFLVRDQRELKGLLQFYELHLISEGRNRIQEILESFNQKSGASWNLKSVMSTLKKLMREGLVLQTFGSLGHSERVYEITSKGAAFLKEGKAVLSNSDRRWFEMRGIFINLMDATSLPEFLSEGARANFQLSREIIEAKAPKLVQKEAESALKEYALNLRKQLTWTEKKIEAMESNKKTNIMEPQSPNLRALRSKRAKRIMSKTQEEEEKSVIGSRRQTFVEVENHANKFASLQSTGNRLPDRFRPGVRMGV